MPFAAALASGLPLLVGAWFGRMDHGLVSSLGGLVFLYLPETPMSHRMVSLMACAFGMTACYALGVMSHLLPAVMMVVLTFTAMLVTMVCRFYRLAPPGSLFFIMAAAIGAYSPGDVLQVPLITLPIVNHDNAQHAKDENIRLQNLWDGIEVFAGVMTRLGTTWSTVVP